VNEVANEPCCSSGAVPSYRVVREFSLAEIYNAEVRNHAHAADRRFVTLFCARLPKAVKKSPTTLTCCSRS
jgi:hypothetical protein